MYLGGLEEKNGRLVAPWSCMASAGALRPPKALTRRDIEVVEI